MRIVLRSAVAAALACAAATQASAVITIGTGTGTNISGFRLITNPAGLISVGNRTSFRNGLNGSFIYGFNERQNVILTSPEGVNLGGSNNNHSTQLPRGTRVSSHMIFFDPVGSATATGSVTFNRPILGVLRSNGSQISSDNRYGAPGVTYVSTGNRGLENGNANNGDFVFAWTPGSNTVNFRFSASDPGDHLRVLTAGVPEPATWAMMILGFGVIGGAMRARRPQKAQVAFS
jgi:hypothetical protein